MRAAAAVTVEPRWGEYAATIAADAWWCCPVVVGTTHHSRATPAPARATILDSTTVVPRSHCRRRTPAPRTKTARVRTTTTNRTITTTRRTNPRQRQSQRLGNRKRTPSVPGRTTSFLACTLLSQRRGRTNPHCPCGTSTIIINTCMAFSMSRVPIPSFFILSTFPKPRPWPPPRPPAPQRLTPPAPPRRNRLRSGRPGLPVP